MRILSATIISVFSGFIVYMIPAMLLEAEAISKLFVVIAFVGGTVGTFCIVLKGVQTATEVWARGSLVWAAEWIVAAMVPIYVSWLAFRESGVPSWGDLQTKATAQSEAWIAALSGVSVCLVMAILSYSLHVIASRHQK